ncbi:MAG: hypothetical protein EBT20_01930, partial [Alphaproteobacteria bacterium]|nr:hypothetical protein [Alphaproteobacteria bacterium]
MDYNMAELQKYKKQNSWKSNFWFLSSTSIIAFAAMNSSVEAQSSSTNIIGESGSYWLPQFDKIAWVQQTGRGLEIKLFDGETLLVPPQYFVMREHEIFVGEAWLKENAPEFMTPKQTAKGDFLALVSCWQGSERSWKSGINDFGQKRSDIDFYANLEGIKGGEFLENGLARLEQFDGGYLTINPQQNAMINGTVYVSGSWLKNIAPDVVSLSLDKAEGSLGSIIACAV